MTEGFKIEIFEGIRYKVFLNDSESGVSHIHIERIPSSDIFEKMTNEESMKYVGDVVRHTLNSIGL